MVIVQLQIVCKNFMVVITTDVLHIKNLLPQHLIKSVIIKLKQPAIKEKQSMNT